MPKNRTNKRLLKHLDSTLVDSTFDESQLLHEHFLNFHFEDNYGFGDHKNKGLIRKRIVKLLVEIHDNWKVELEKLNQPYYLAIWLCEPKIIRSDVVCAIGERIEMYESNWFDVSDNEMPIRAEFYGKLEHQMLRFDWKRNNAYDTYDSIEFERPKEWYRKESHFYKEQRFYKKLIRRNTRAKETQFGKTYYHKIGDIWVGREK